MAYTKRIEILSNCPTQIINYNFITRDQIEDIRLAIIDCLKKYDMENSTDFIIKSVEISKKLKTTAGNIHWRGEEGAMVFEIKLAYNNLLEFGAESMIKTLRHEMAHLIEVVHFGKSGHSDRFKKICVNVGGHMNGKLSGWKYADNATTDYCKRKRMVKKYEYRCDCTVHKRVRRIGGRKLFSRCVHCGMAVRDMKLTIVG